MKAMKQKIRKIMKGAAFALLLFVVVGVFLEMRASHAYKEIASSMTELKAEFARAVGTQSESVTDLYVLKTVGHPSLRSLWLGVYLRDESLTGSLVPVQDCNGQPSPAPAVTLGLVDLIEPLAAFDLKGQPFSLNLQDLQSLDRRRLQLTGAEVMPALLLRTKRVPSPGEKWDTLLLYTLEKNPRLLWQEITQVIYPGGGGYKTFEFTLEKSEKNSEPLDILLFQTTIPGDGEIPFQPGPPLLLRFSIKEDTYRRVDE